MADDGFVERRKWYYVPSKSLPGFDPITFGEESCLPLHFRGVSVCDYWILHYVVSGKGTLLIGDDVYEVSPSQCFIVRPFDHFFYQADEHDPWHYIWISFRADADMSPFADKHVISSQGLHSAFSRIMDAKDMRYGQQEYLSARIWDIVSLFYNSVKAPISQKQEYVQKAKSYIEAHFTEDIGVSEIADMLSLDRSYFSTLFKKTEGVSPGRYLTEYRMNVAYELITVAGYGVSDAAYAVGYNDVVSFSRMFKKFYGTSPVEYKK